MPASAYRLLLATFVAAIFVSAALLFAVQPLFAKMVLPRLGGTPAVWSVAMVFFQAMLLIGYAYAQARSARFEHMASTTSATARIRASRRMASPFKDRG